MTTYRRTAEVRGAMSLAVPDAALFSGAGLSFAAPASLPLARTFNRQLSQVCYAAARQVAPDVVHPDLLEAVTNGHCNLLGRLESTRAGSGAAAVGCMRSTLPNEAHLLAAVHLALGGLHVTVNFDECIEHAYALLAGRAALPAGVPSSYVEALADWRRCVPRPVPVLRVVSAPHLSDAGALRLRPLLVKLHGSQGRRPDGVVLRGPEVTDDVEVTEVGRHRTKVLDVLGAEAFVVVTGYSGKDVAGSTEVVDRLRPGRFRWVAPEVLPDVDAAIRAIDSDQPVPGRAVDALRACIPFAVPTWPVDGPVGPTFDERFTAWARSLPAECAATAFAWALTDVGRVAEAVPLLQRLGERVEDGRTQLRLAQALALRDEPGDRSACTRIYLRTATRGSAPGVRSDALAAWGTSRAGQAGVVRGAVLAAVGASVAAGALGGDDRRASTALGMLLAWVEGRVPGALGSPARSRALAAVASRADAQARRYLRLSENEPGGRRRALVHRQQLELAAIVALLRPHPLPPDAGAALRRMQDAYEHLSDAAGLSETLGTRALVCLAAGRRVEATQALQEAMASRRPVVGVVAMVRDLLVLDHQVGPDVCPRPASRPPDAPGPAARVRAGAAVP